jgi:hypothetical protein
VIGYEDEFDFEAMIEEGCQCREWKRYTESRVRVPIWAGTYGW